MAQPHRPPHLPRPARDPNLSGRICRFNDILDGIEYVPAHHFFAQIPIPPGTPAKDVYQMLPSSPYIEVGGYLTAKQIRFLIGKSDSVQSMIARPCVFHSHPTESSYADRPSEIDIYQFLRRRPLRAITVGARWIWIWDKTKAVIQTALELVGWEAENIVYELERLTDRGVEGFCEEYVPRALRAVGLSWPHRRYKSPKRWSRLLRESLGIHTRLIRRESR